VLLNLLILVSVSRLPSGLMMLRGGR
jgi:hypothetical protein